MIKIKSFILDETKWLGVTWVDEISTQVDVEKEVDGEIVVETETKIEEVVVWCESYSGHPEHIQMLMDRAELYGTELDEYVELIVECEAAYIAPTEEEIEAEIVANKIAEYKAYLSATDYKMTIDYYSGMTEVEQLDITAKRAEAREYIRLHQ